VVGCLLSIPGRRRLKNFLPGLTHADRTERIGLAWPTERRLGLLPGFQQRFVRPARNERCISADLVDAAEDSPGAIGHEGQTFFTILYWRMHVPSQENQCLLCNARGESYSTLDASVFNVFRLRHERLRLESALVRPSYIKLNPHRNMTRSRRTSPLSKRGATEFFAPAQLIMARIIAVIPARMGSTRFPGKPLAPLLGRPMIEHVVRRAEMCDLLDEVYVATCDEEIRSTVRAFGGAVIMTSPAHERASERVAEAADHIEADIVVMIQGDEPMITPAMIGAAVAPMLDDGTVSCVNLVQRINNQQDHLDPNTIKVVMNVHGDALYFSRAPVPAVDFTRSHALVFKQVCVIPFRRDFLRQYARWVPTPLELAESIDMLRVIEHGGRVRLVETDTETHAVDTTEDLRLVAALMKDDPRILQYGGLGIGAEARV
jgi:3-deoxy-manno-octulosonate cytidylyltransferase (CMP-KDO synthetase)